MYDFLLDNTDPIYVITCLNDWWSNFMEDCKTDYNCFFTMQVEFVACDEATTHAVLLKKFVSGL